MSTKFEVVRPGFIARSDSSSSATAIDTDTEKPSDGEILTTIVACSGVVPQVAAKLSISQEDVYNVIARNPRMLSTMLRARLMVDTFTSLCKLQLTLAEVLPEMLPGDVGRTLAAQTAAFTNLAGQFEEQETADTDDDTSSGKQYILDKIDKLGKRDDADRVLGSSSSGDEQAV